ncbi:MAG: DUF4430 domain-containing protein [Promethearchaeota archaeon]
MKVKNIFLLSIASLLIVSVLLTAKTPITRANSTIPEDYHQEIDLNGDYVYNVTLFGEKAAQWWGIDWSYRGDYFTNEGGQFHINFTGFYEKHSNDNTNFREPIPYLDIEIFNLTNSVLISNFTANNISNTEAAQALTLGFNNFQPGFLIPNKSLAQVISNATNEATGWVSGNVITEETYNFLYIGFKQTGGGQITNLAYDKKTGLLVWAKTKVGGFSLEILLNNFSLDFNEIYKYNISRFGEENAEWWNMDWGKDGEYFTNTGGQVHINFTGYYDKHSNDGTLFESPIPWLDIDIYNKTNTQLSLNFSLNNISNTEAAFNMILGYNNFQPGFLIPIMDNLSLVIQMAETEATGGINGNVFIQHSNLTIKIVFLQVDGVQKTYLIYEKLTGLLLWADISLGGYQMEMTIEGFTPSSYEDLDLEEPPEEGEEEDNNRALEPDWFQQWLPFISIVSIVGAITGGIVIGLAEGTKIPQKFLGIMVIGVAAFTGFFLYSSGMIPGINQPNITQDKEPAEVVRDLTLIIDYGDGHFDKWEDLKLEGGKTTVFDLLDAKADIEYEDYGEMGYLVTNINGYDIEDKPWLYGVNGEQIGYSASLCNLKDGDVVNWIHSQKYEAAK